MTRTRNKQKITFNYKKSNDYKSFHIDGIYGGILPTANIWFETFYEKRNFPEKVVCELDGKTGRLEEIEKFPKEENEILRELQAGFTMTLGTAKVIRNWLDDKIRTIEAELNKIRK